MQVKGACLVLAVDVQGPGIVAARKAASILR